MNVRFQLRLAAALEWLCVCAFAPLRLASGREIAHVEVTACTDP